MRDIDILHKEDGVEMAFHNYSNLSERDKIITYWLKSFYGEPGNLIEKGHEKNINEMEILISIQRASKEVNDMLSLDGRFTVQFKSCSLRSFGYNENNTQVNILLDFYFSDGNVSISA